MIKLTLGERILVGWLINQIQGLNKTDARMVLSVQRSFDTENATQATKEEVDNTGDFTPTMLELQWVADQINKNFEAARIPPMLARQAIEFLDKLERLRSEPPGEALLDPAPDPEGEAQ